MTERTAPEAGAIACPFVAFVDDRDARADIPDHRHRCYAEIRPAPRAIAHQQTYCLSPAFAACPTFQDWARRESARARSGSTTAGTVAEDAALAAASGATIAREAEGGEAVDAATGAPADFGQRPAELDEESLDDEPFDDRASRNPHRDWADPPPWADPTTEPGSTDGAAAPAFLTNAGRQEPTTGGSKSEEAGSAAGLSASRWLQDVPPPRTTDQTAIPTPAYDPNEEVERALEQERAEREGTAAVAAGVAATASSSRAARKAAAPQPPPKVSDSRKGGAGRTVAGPAWERPRRNEAYPTIKTRIGLPAIPRVGLAALALIVAAVVLFSLPFVLRLGGDQGGSGAASPSPTSAASAATAPTEAPSPTAKVYVVKPGDTLNKIAKRYNLTVDQLLAANKQIKNPNRIAVGDEIVIPVISAPSDVIDTSSAEPSPSTP